LARRHLTPAPFGNITLDRLRKSHIEGLIVRPREQALSDSTVRQTYTVLRAILTDAKLMVWLPKMRHCVSPGHGARQEATSLPPEEVVALLAAADDLRYRNVLMLVATLGF
jgi:hypothetical protein